MKKVVLGIITFLLLAGGTYFVYNHFFAGPKLNQYTFDINYLKEKKQLSCKEEVTYVNNTGKSLNEIYFKLYLNSFRIPDKNHPRINISRIYNDDEDYKYKLEGEDISNLIVVLKKSLKPGKKQKINFDFKVNLPEFSEELETDRFGVCDDFINVGNCYPIAAVCDNNGFKVYRSIMSGSDFYNTSGYPYLSDAANYNVKINVPKDYVIAATGDQEKVETIGDRKIYTYKADKTRQFTFTGSTKYKLAKEVVDGVNINIYYTNSDFANVDKIAQNGINAFRIFNKYYGKYPYDNLCMIETPYYFRMQYSQMVFMNTDYINNAKNDTGANDIGYYALIHEMGKQWFANVVGNDQVNETWLDEGFARFSEYLYYKELSLANDAVDFYDDPDDFQGYFRTRRSLKVVRPMEEFKDWDEYYLMTHCKGAGTLKALKREVGDKVFFDIMSTYYNKYKFKIATTKDFINVAEKVSNKNLDTLFNKWLYNK